MRRSFKYALLILSIILLIYTTYKNRDRYLIYFKGEVATGTVLGYKEEISGDEVLAFYYRPQVEYSYKNKKYVCSGFIGLVDKKYVIGQSVHLKFLSSNPNECVINSEYDWEGVRFNLIVTLGLIVIAIYLVKKQK